MSRLERVFGEAVFESAGNYVPGSRVEHESRWSFLVSSETLSLRIGCNWSNVVYVECWLKPSAGVLALLPNTEEVLGDPVYLYEILRCIAPDVPDSESYPRPMMLGLSIRREVERQFRLISTHCSKLIAGDLASWHSVVECLRNETFRRKADEPDKDYCDRLLRLADREWHLGRYWNTARAYAMLAFLGKKLTLGQRFRLWRARKRIFLM